MTTQEWTTTGVITKEIAIPSDRALAPGHERHALIALPLLLVLTVGLTACGETSSSFLDKSGPQYAPTGSKTTCATVSDPVAVVIVYSSDTSAPAPTCTSLSKGYQWADPSVPGHTLICTTDNTEETGKVYDALGSSDYSKGLCAFFAKGGVMVTYPH